MELKIIEHHLSVCKVADLSDIDLKADFYFIGKTDEELSLVCKTAAPAGNPSWITGFSYADPDDRNPPLYAELYKKQQGDQHGKKRETGFDREKCPDLYDEPGPGYIGPRVISNPG